MAKPIKHNAGKMQHPDEAQYQKQMEQLQQLQELGQKKQTEFSEKYLASLQELTQKYNENLKNLDPTFSSVEPKNDLVLVRAKKAEMFETLVHENKDPNGNTIGYAYLPNVTQLERLGVVVASSKEDIKPGKLVQFKGNIVNPSNLISEYIFIHPNALPTKTLPETTVVAPTLDEMATFGYLLIPSHLIECVIN
jgi:hypothetical protein